MLFLSKKTLLSKFSSQIYSIFIHLLVCSYWTYAQYKLEGNIWCDVIWGYIFVGRAILLVLFDSSCLATEWAKFSFLPLFLIYNFLLQNDHMNEKEYTYQKPYSIILITVLIWKCVSYRFLYIYICVYIDMYICMYTHMYTTSI